MRTQTEVRTNYLYQAAGRAWEIPKLELTSLPDGSLAIAEAEIERIHRAIANEICGHDSGLSVTELEFLCDLAGRSFAEVAGALQVHRSTVTRWRKSGEVPGRVMSRVLKKWFWNLLFGRSLAGGVVPLDCAVDETRLLTFLRQETLDQHLVDPVGRASANTP